MKILLALLLFASSLKADWFGDGNFNLFYGGQFMTNTMNILSNNITRARTHGLPYVIHPKLCVFNMTWDTMRTGGQNAANNNPSRLSYSLFRANTMPALGQNNSARVFGSRILSYMPDE